MTKKEIMRDGTGVGDATGVATAAAGTKGFPLYTAAEELLAALKAITEACEADCGGPITDGFGDDDSVGYGDTSDMALTFGMIRRARAAIAKAEGK